MVRVIADLRNPEQRGWWETRRAMGILRRRPDDLVDALDKNAARHLARLHEQARADEIRATGLVDGVLADLDPKEWFGEGRSRVDFMRHRVIRADGKEAVGVEFAIGPGGVSLTPIKALARLVGDDQFRFLELLAETVLGRLGREALDLETGERGAASVAWWMSLFGTDEHAAIRIAAQEAFAKGEPCSSVEPPANNAVNSEGELAEAATPTSGGTAPRPVIAEPQRRKRDADKRDRVVEALLHDHKTKASLKVLKIIHIESRYSAKRTTASEAKKIALATFPDDPN